MNHSTSPVDHHARQLQDDATESYAPPRQKDGSAIRVLPPTFVELTAEEIAEVVELLTDLLAEESERESDGEEV